MESKRKKTLESFVGNEDVHKKVSLILDSLEEIRMKENSQMIRKIISDIGRIYNPMLCLPSELLCEIFLFLPLEEILGSRFVFLVCKNWTDSINNYFPFWTRILQRLSGQIIMNNEKYSLAEIRSYCVTRYCIRNRKVITPRIKYRESKNNHLAFLNIQNYERGVKNPTSKDRRSSFSSEEVFEYLVWKEGLEKVIVCIKIFNDIFRQKREKLTERAVCRLNIDVNGSKLLEFTYNSSNLVLGEFVVHEECIRNLEKEEFVNYLISSKIISAPRNVSISKTIPRNIEYKPKVISHVTYSGSDLFGVEERRSPTLSKIFFNIFSLIQVIRGINNGGRPRRDTIIKEYFNLGENYPCCNNVFIKIKGRKKLRLDEYLKNNKLFVKTEF